MRTVLLPPGVNPITINKCINMCRSFASALLNGLSMYSLYSFHVSVLFAMLDDGCLVYFMADCQLHIACGIK